MAYEVYAFLPNEEDFSTFGEVGALEPLSCIHEEIAGGISQITIEHPLDKHGKYRILKLQYILQAYVPVRTTPEINGTQLVTSVEKWTVLSTASKAQRMLYTKAVKGKKKKVVAPKDKQDNATAVIVTKRGADRYKVKTPKNGTGWIDKNALTGGVTVVIPNTPSGIEEVMPAWSMQQQLFRITQVTQDDKSKTVKAEAQHISYDLMGNLTTYIADEPTADEAIQGILENCAEDHEFEAYTNVVSKRIDIAYERINPIKALLDPKEGVIARYGLEMVRDDFELTFLDEAGVDRGVVVEYGKNMLGITCDTDMSSVVTCILPVGESKAGKPCYLGADPDKVYEDISDASYIKSANIGDYATPHIMELVVSDAKVDSKKGGKNVTPKLAAERMREEANQAFSNGVQFPQVKITVDWLRLGDTAEYAEFAELDNAFLYDPVTARHKAFGIDTALKVMRLKTDCLTGKYIETELGATGDITVNSAIPSWQIPAIDGKKLMFGSVSNGALMTDILTAEDIADNAITSKKIGDGTIANRHIEDGALAQEKIAGLTAALTALAQRITALEG